MAEFGKEIMKKEFILDSSSKKAFVNHGAYGPTPRKVLDHRFRSIQKMEEQPDTWFRDLSDGMWLENLAAVADFLGSKPENLFFIANATTGFNTVLKSLEFRIGDAILLNTWTYFSLKNSATSLAERLGLEVFCVDNSLHLNSIEELLDSYERMFIQHPNIKLVVLDDISSMPPMLMPLHQLVPLCRKYGKLIFVDGAHSPGQLSLNLEQRGVDFFTGNLYKWAYAPRACGVLWIDPKFHKQIFPVVISRLKNEYWKLFSYQGTNDVTQWYSAKKAVEFYKEIGGYDKIYDYCSKLVAQGADLLVQKWNTKHFPLPDDMKAPFMRMVRIPDLRKYPATCITPDDDIILAVIDIADLTRIVWERFHVQAVFMSIDNEPWVRISANVYNVIQDYELLADAILELKREEEQTELKHNLS
jgi:selenocysteine lyase/cysteine desulfurase